MGVQCEAAVGHPGGAFLQALGATELRYGVGGFNTDHESMRGHTGGSGQKLKAERAEGRGHLQGDGKKISTEQTVKTLV